MEASKWSDHREPEAEGDVGMGLQMWESTAQRSWVQSIETGAN